MEHPLLAELGAVVGALGCLLALLSYDRAPSLLGVAAVAVAEVAVGASLLGTATIDRLVSPTGAVAAFAACLLLGVGAAILVRWPEALAPLAVALAPLRPPLDFGPEHPLFVAAARDGRLGRLIPLYTLLACATLAFVWRLYRRGGAPPLPRALARPASLLLAFVCLSLLWAEDREAAANYLFFFALPFATLLCIVGRTPAALAMPRHTAWVATGLAALFAAIGIWQFATHELFFYAPNLALSNANTDLFRVTSLFGDPSLYARHLVLALCVILVAFALGRLRARYAWPLAALLWIGMLFSFSQTSMVALIAAACAIAVTLGGRRLKLAATAAALAASLLAVGYGAWQVANGVSVNRVSSDRLGRLERTLDAAGESPLFGVGIASQPRVSKRLAHSDRPTASFAAHTAPAAVIAELGALGFALFAWACVGVWRTLAELRRFHEPLAVALGACLIALFVHALGYSNLLEDPLTWVLPALAASWLARPDPESRWRARQRARSGEPAARGAKTRQLSALPTAEAAR